MANFGRRNLGPWRGNSRDLSPQGPFSGDLSRSKKNPDRGSGFLRGFAAGQSRSATVSAAGRRGGAAARVRASGCRAVRPHLSEGQHNRVRQNRTFAGLRCDGQRIVTRLGRRKKGMAHQPYAPSGRQTLSPQGTSKNLFEK